MNVVRLGPTYLPQSSIGRPIANADIYVGIPDTDPEIVGNQLTLYVQEEDGTITAVAQPVSTGAGGIPMYDGSPVTLLVDRDYSLKVLNSSGVQIYYVPQVAVSFATITTGYCTPNYLATDQGASEILTTIKSCVDSIGTDGGTILLRHNSAGATTTYTLSTDETIPSNVNLIIEKGAIIAIDTGKTLTINGAFETGSYTSFTPTSTVVFGSGIGKINVLWFGADATGATASDVAVTHAIESAMTSGVWGQHSIYFPTGLYKFTTSGVLSNIGTTGKQGIHFVGDGMRSSRLYLAPSGADLWFYDTYGDTTERSQFVTFTDMAFFGTSDPSSGTYASISEYAKGFRIYGATHEQGFKFHRCSMAMLDTVFDFEGSNLASEIGIIQCKISQVSDVVYLINNIGSLNHTFIDTDLETVWGDFIRVGTSGGGAVKVYGGSWIAQTGAAYSTADEYVLDIPVPAAIGSNASIFTFNSVRFENSGNNAMLVRHLGGQISAIFRDCIFWSSSVTAAKTDWVKIIHNAFVLFDACAFSWGNTTYYENYSLDSATQYGQPGKIKWQNCLVHDDLSEHITFTNNYGRASVIGCFGDSVGAQSAMFAVDFDMFGISAYTDLIGGANESHIPLKTVSIMYLQGFPFNNVAEATVKLPKGALIKSIKVQKNATGASAADYCLHVGNDDKSTIYASSVKEVQSKQHVIYYERGSKALAQITTRTDNDTAVLTFHGGNNAISDGDTVNVHWVVGGAAGRRTAMTVSSISYDTTGQVIISLDGGAGHNFPAVNSDVILTSILSMINVGATDNERTVRLWSSDGDGSTAGGNESHTAGYAVVEYY